MRVGVNALFLLPGEVGGSEVYLNELLPAVTRVSASLDIVVFTNRENHACYEGYERVPLHVAAASRPKRILFEQTALPRAARRAGVDLLFSAGYTAPLYCALPRATTIFDAQFRAFPRELSLAQRLAYNVLVGGSARTADRVLTLSQFSARELHTRLGIPLKAIAVTPPGLPSLPEPGVIPESVRRPFLLYVSNTYPHKNVPRLAEAFLHIADRIPHSLVIVGRNRGGEPPRDERIVRLEGVSREALSALYRQCDAFVNPSRYEGFGFPTLEAMAAGARVIAATTGATTEVAGDAASYFDPVDPIQMADVMLGVLHESREERARFIGKGLERAKLYSWDECARVTVKAFEEALGERKAHPV